MEARRLFFALETHAPWPEVLPEGRHIEEKFRHITLAFLGKVNFSQFENIPSPQFISPVGLFDHPVFLPPRSPRVAAWHIQWLSSSEPILKYRENLIQWLLSQGFIFEDRRPFLFHATIARTPFHIKDWKKHFSPLPLYCGSLHLYESLEYSQYSSCWEAPIIAPFEELEHTADIAYRVNGKDFPDLYIHAFIALCFTFPSLLSYHIQCQPQSLEEIIIVLNEIIAKADGEIGCPFKAVSFHGSLKKNTYFTWEMIIDV